MTLSDRLEVAIALAAGASAVIAAVYTVVTARILKTNREAVAAMRSQVSELTRPRVMIWPSVRVGTQLLCLTVRNGGSSPAENLRMTLDHDFHVFGDKAPDKNLASFSAFSSVIEALPPGAEMLFYLGAAHQLFGPTADAEASPRTFSVRASYEHANRSFVENTTVDLRPFYESAVPQDPIAEEVEKVAKELQQLRREFSSFRQEFRRP